MLHLYQVRHRENRSPEQEGITTCNQATGSSGCVCENRSPEQEGITTPRAPGLFSSADRENRSPEQEGITTSGLVRLPDTKRARTAALNKKGLRRTRMRPVFVRM